MGLLRLWATKRKESRWWNVQFAFRQCSFNSLCEEGPEPIPQITCSLIQASRCSIDTVVRTQNPNELIINCNRRGRQGDHTAPQYTKNHVYSFLCHTNNTYLHHLYNSQLCYTPCGKGALLLHWHGYSGQTASSLRAEDAFSLHIGLFYWCVSASFTSALLMCL